MLLLKRRKKNVFINLKIKIFSKMLTVFEIANIL